MPRLLRRSATPRAWMMQDTAQRMAEQAQILREAPRQLLIEAPHPDDAALLATQLRSTHPQVRLYTQTYARPEHFAWAALLDWLRPKQRQHHAQATASLALRHNWPAQHFDWVMALFPSHHSALTVAAQPSNRAPAAKLHAATERQLADHALNTVSPTATHGTNEANREDLWLSPLLAYWRRLLRDDGVLFIATLGPSSALDLHGLEGFSEALAPPCVDLHDLGDALVQAGFADPVIGAETVKLTFTQPQRCLEELQRMGWRFAHEQAQNAFTRALVQERTPPFACRVEINLAHAFRANTRPGSGVDLDDLRRSLRR